VALLDGDDLWMPHRLESVVGFLEGHPEIGFATSDAFFMNGEPAPAERYYQQLPGGFRADDQAYWILEYNFIMGMAVIRRRLFDLYGTFDESLPAEEGEPEP
jgi:hypothetical protein